MANINFADKSQLVDYVASKWNAQDANEIKKVLNSMPTTLTESFTTTGGMTIASNSYIKANPGVIVTCDINYNRSGFKADNAENIVIEGVTFDLATANSTGGDFNADSNFTTAIDFRNCKNVWIINCRFINSNIANANPDWTLQATNFQNLNGLYMFGNWADGAQYKLCGASASLENVIFVQNYGKRDTQMGMSFVVQPAGGAEVASLQITSGVTTSGNVTVSLDGTPTNVAVSAGVAEVASLQIAGTVTTAGDVTVTLDGVATNVAVALNDTAIAVADKIRAASFTGWTTGGTVGTDTVTFTANAVGTRTDTTFSVGTAAGVTGTVTTTTQGTAADTAIGVADKIRATSFTGWTTGGTVGTDTVTFTANDPGEKTDATYADGSTGAAGTITTTTQGWGDSLKIRNIHIVDNIFEDIDQHAIYGGVDNGQGVYPGDVEIKNITIRGNTVNGLAYLNTTQTSKGILLNLTRSTKHVNVLGNQIYGAPGNTAVQGIQVNTSPTDVAKGLWARNIKVNDNQITACANFNIVADDIDFFQVKDNMCEDGKGIITRRSSNGKLKDNQFLNTTATLRIEDNCSNIDSDKPFADDAAAAAAGVPVGGFYYKTGVGVVARTA